MFILEIITSLFVGLVIGAFGMAIMSGNAYKKGYKDAKRMCRKF